MIKTYKGLIKELKPNQIFVFGSNTQGRHGAGAAYHAINCFGAIYWQSRGRQGQSYAICTKDLTKEIHPSVSREEIIEQIATLYEYARQHNQLEFFIAYSGTGRNLNYYTPQDMADMFSAIQPIPENIIFEEEFAKLLEKEYDKKN